MKRNKELLKCILRYVEEHGKPYEKLWFDENTLTADSEEVKYHIRLLAQAGFITSDGIRQGFEGIKELTWAGHDYLDGLRNG